MDKSKATHAVTVWISVESDEEAEKWRKALQAMVNRRIKREAKKKQTET